MREEARRARDQSGAPKNRDDYTQTFGGKGSSVPPGGPYTSSSSGPRPPWERNNEQWDPWSSDVPHGAYDVPRPPPKAPPKSCYIKFIEVVLKLPAYSILSLMVFLNIFSMIV